MLYQQVSALPQLGPVFQSLPALYLILQPDLTIVEATDAYLESMHLNRSNVVGKRITAIIGASQQEPALNLKAAIEQSAQHVITHQEPHTLPELRHDIPLSLTPEGSFEERYWSFTNSPVMDAAGSLLYILHEARDITEKIITRPAYHHTKEHLPYFPEAVNAVSWEYDVVQNKMYWGPGLQTIFGYTPEQMGQGGESWDARVHPEDYKRVQNSIEEANAAGSKIWTGEYRFLKADGTYIPVMDQGYIIYNKHGKPIRTIGSIIDLTYHTPARETLQESDTRFRHLLEVLPHMAWMAEPGGKMLYFNKNWYSYTGMQPDQTDGWTRYIHPEDTAIVLTEWHNTMASGQPSEIEYRLYDHHDKSYRWFLERGVPMYGASGELQFWIGTLTDIEEQKQAMEKMREKDLQLEKILNHSPVHMCLLRGPQHICSYVTSGVYILAGNRSFVGKPAAEIWPELQNTNFQHVLANVYQTGKTVKVNELKVTIDRLRNGQLTDIYLNLEYRPLTDSSGQTEGILISAFEVTELVETKQKAEKLALALHSSKSCV